MKEAIKLAAKIVTLALASALVACGGGGGSPASTTTAVLSPGIWVTSSDTNGVRTTFVGVVTSSNNGGEVWGLSETMNISTNAKTSSKLFTGSVSASGEDFKTTTGTELLCSASHLSGWSYTNPGCYADAATGKVLTLPKSTDTTKQSFVFDSPTTYATSLANQLWSSTAQLNSANDWNATWTLAEEAPDPLNVNATVTVTYSWAVSSTGAITGFKTVQGQAPCSIKEGSAVTAREKAVVNVNVTYVCSDGEEAYSGISFPLTESSVVNTRAVWMKRTGTSNEFVTQKFTRAP